MDTFTSQVIAQFHVAFSALPAMCLIELIYNSVLQTLLQLFVAFPQRQAKEKQASLIPVLISEQGINKLRDAAGI